MYLLEGWGGEVYWHEQRKGEMRETRIKMINGPIYATTITTTTTTGVGATE